MDGQCASLFMSLSVSLAVTDAWRVQSLDPSEGVYARGQFSSLTEREVWRLVRRGLAEGKGWVSRKSLLIVGTPVKGPAKVRMGLPVALIFPGGFQPP